ncbi:hypothetical protein [Peribacillus acanthi]|uniref:hypothetical protein n=1 Tax=Peribacillus acanthi TaxID=2171554 RepID=UPI000D3E5D38|nr:hypothetical protein [Peribacillus acanthi]
MKKALLPFLMALLIIPVTLVATATGKDNIIEEKTAFINIVTDIKGTYVQVDEIEWYEGEQANLEAEKDGDCYEEDGKCVVPDGYYIRNSDDKLQKLSLASDTTIFMQTYQIDQTYEINWDQEITWEQLLKEWNHSSERYQHIPFHLVIKDGEIISIKEQYIP